MNPGLSLPNAPRKRNDADHSRPRGTPPDASMDRAHIFHPCRNPNRSVRPFPPSADRAPRIKRKHENRIETVFCDPFLVRYLFVGVAHADAHGRIARLVRAFHVLSKRF